ncbi:MAG: hypothetical protein JXJ30_09405 [Halothiobacillaceae bacterium]|nr:hypothetical protein [Halothiobacillaceae bacterium]
MEEESGSSEAAGPSKRGSRSAQFDFFVFVLVFGWEGPFAVFMGLKMGSVAHVLVGLLLTAFFWGVFGVDLLKDFIKGLVR